MVKRTKTTHRAATATNRPMTKAQQKRVTAAFLINERKLAAADAAQIVGFSRASDADKWAQQLAGKAHAGDAPRSGRPPTVQDKEVKLLAAALARDRIGTGVARLAAKLHRAGKVSKRSASAWRRALVAAGFAVQDVKHDIARPATTRASRLAFARRYRDRCGGQRWAFTDSSVFFGGGSWRGPSQHWRAWAKKGKPRVVIKRRPAYKVTSAPKTAEKFAPRSLKHSRSLLLTAPRALSSSDSRLRRRLRARRDSSLRGERHDGCGPRLHLSQEATGCEWWRQRDDRVCCCWRVLSRVPRPPGWHRRILLHAWPPAQLCCAF